METGIVSRAIREKAGAGMQELCNRHGTLAPGEIEIMKSQDLPAGTAYFGSILHWQSGEQQCKRVSIRLQI